MLKRSLLKVLTLQEKEKYLVLIVVVLCLIILFSFIEISETKEQLKSKNKINIENSILKMSQGEEKHDIDAFVKKYLDNIFNSNSDSDLTWLKEHSDQKFFLDTLSAHLSARIEKKIASNFSIERFYREDLDRNIEKIIVFGEEKFSNSNYENRVLVIELILNTELLKVEEIISIKTLNE